MAAEGVVEVVEKLQSRLTGGGEPKKLYKSLKRLAELPITIEILAETGVGKTVNSLRKHELVGEFAKSLVARWKKLVPQEVDRSVNSSEREPDRSVSRKHPRDPSPQKDEEEQESGYRTMVQVSRDKKSRKESDQVHKVQEERWHNAPPEQNSDIEDFDDGPSYLVEPPDSPPLIYIDQREPDRSSSHRKTVKGPRESVEVATRSISKEPRPHLEKYRVEAKVGEMRSQDRLSKHTGKELHREQDKVESLVGGSWQKLENLEGGEQSAKKWRGHEPVNLSSISRKERSHIQSDIGHEHAALHGVLKKEPHESSERVKKQKHIEKEKSKGEPTRLNTDGQSAEREKARTEREGKSKSRSADTSMHERKSVKFSSALDSEEEDMFEQPTMSFESCLTYDLPKKKKKLVKHPAPPQPPNPISSVKGSSSSRQNGARESSKASEPSRKNVQPKRERTPSPPAKARKIKIDAVPVLPDIPLPPIQPNYRPLPTLDTVTFSPQKKKLVTPTPIDEEESGFTGRRFNSKMQVYSGSKTTYLPKMMSLYEQCIRVLANNIDLIDEVGGVPYSLLEPVLEKCTPEQLYRIEECNHVLIEDTDRLWMGHCQREFKKEQAEEFESWREMYLRLHDAREQKLAMLTQNIRSAHANRPKVRQAKMAFVNVEAKPPRDVRRRQEKFGTGGAVVKEKIRIKPAPFTPMRTSLAPSEESYTADSRSYSDEPRSYDEPSTSSAYSATSTSSVSPPLSDPRRPLVKKIAPMMAKTIKAFKNRFSRR